MTEPIESIEEISETKRKKVSTPYIETTLQQIFWPISLLKAKLSEIILSNGERIKENVWNNLEKNRQEKRSWRRLDRVRENWNQVFAKIDQKKILNRRVDIIR